MVDWTACSSVGWMDGWTAGPKEFEMVDSMGADSADRRVCNWAASMVDNWAALKGWIPAGGLVDRKVVWKEDSLVELTAADWAELKAEKTADWTVCCLADTKVGRSVGMKET